MNAVYRLDESAQYTSAMQFAAELDMVQWTEQHRRLDDKTSAMPGAWRWSVVPQMIEPYLAWSDYKIREVTIQGCTQFGKSEFANNIIGHTIDQDPAPLMVVMPTEDQVKDRVRTRIRPMLESNPQLLAHLGGDIESLNTSHATEFDSCLLYLAWAGSPTTLGDKPVGKIVIDEAKDMKPQGNQTDPINLARKRLRTFAFSKLLVVSSPTDDDSLITREFEAGDQRELHVPCPYCLGYQELLRDHINIRKDEDGNYYHPSAYVGGGFSAYTCPHCDMPWNEADRMRAMSKCIWLPLGAEVYPNTEDWDQLPSARDTALWSHRGQALPTIRLENIPKELPTHVSYHVAAYHLHTQFQTINDLVAAYVAAEVALRAGDTDAMQDFINNEEGLVWHETAGSIEEDILTARTDTYVLGTVPDGIEIVTLGADIQADHIYTALWGWGYGFEAWLLDFQRIETGDTKLVENWEPVRQLLAKWGALAGFDLGLFDYQYNGEIVAQFCRECSGQFLVECVQGEDWQKQLISRRKIGVNREKRQATSRRRRRKEPETSLPLWGISAGDFKNRWSRMTEIERLGPGRVHLPADVTEDFKKQFSSEYLHVFRKGNTVKKEWTVKKKHAANHYWDCSVYALAAAEIRGVRNILSPDEKKEQAPTIKLSDLQNRRRG